MNPTTLTPAELANEGKTFYSQGNYYESAVAFQSAANGYESAGDQLNAAEMLNNCAVALLKGKDFPTALQAVEGTDAIFASAGDVKRQAMALGNRGAILEGLGRLDEAIDAYDQSAALFKQIGEHEMRIPILRSLSNLQLRTKRPMESLLNFDAELGEIEGLSAWQKFIRKLLRLQMKLLFRS